MIPRTVVLLAGVAVALAACAAPQRNTVTSAPTPASDNTAASPVPVAGYTVRPTPPPSGKPALENLPGMNAAGITKLLGLPQFRRRDGQVEIWQYRAANCTLDLFLYAESGDMRVRYVEPRGRTAQATANDAQVRACATGLLQSRAGS